MKTSIYNKDEHLEGYFGKGDDQNKSDLQKEHEQGNEGNEVTAFGTISETNADSVNIHEGNVNARDGFDNTGTQGRDSLSDDTYNSPDHHHTTESASSGTGSSSKDFEDTNSNVVKQRDEDDALNTGI